MPIAAWEGLKVFGRKKSTQSESPAESPLQGRRKVSDSNNLDAIATRWRQGDLNAEREFWSVILALPEWHFIARGGQFPSTEVMPFIGVMDDGSSMIHAYTSQERANIGKDSLDLSDRSRDPTGGNGYALLSMSPESAIRAFAPLATNGVKGIVFDVPSVGAFALLVNLPGMWAHAGGKPIVDIVLPPAPGEVLHLARVVQGVQGAEVQAAKLKLLRRFLHLDRVGLVTQAVGSDLPATLADGDRRFMLVVASPEGAQATKQFIMSKGGAEPGVGSVSIRECVEYLRGLRTSEMGIAHFMIDVGSAFHIESIDELTALWDSSPEIQKRQAAVESRHQQSQKG